MKLFKQNDRVVDAALGAGVICNVLYCLQGSVKPFAYAVIFDDTAHLRCYCSENPCLVFPDTLTSEVENDETI